MGLGSSFPLWTSRSVAAALGYEHIAVGQNSQRPGCFQTRNDSVRFEGQWLAGTLGGS